MVSNGAVRNRRRVEGSLAEPNWAAVISTAPQGRTHDRTRTRRRFCSIALEPKGPSTHEEIARQTGIGVASGYRIWQSGRPQH